MEKFTANIQINTQNNFGVFTREELLKFEGMGARILIKIIDSADPTGVTGHEPVIVDLFNQATLRAFTSGIILPAMPLSDNGIKGLDGLSYYTGFWRPT